MKLVSYNVENFFLRAKAMNAASQSTNKDVLALQAKLNTLLAKDSYTSADKTKIVDWLTELGLGKSDDAPLVKLRQNHGHFVKRPKGQPMQVVASGRADWIGWVDLEVEAVDEVATQMTARVVADLAPDVLCVVEAESRPALLRFSDELLPAAGGTSFAHVMLVDGNDDRGIDVGLMLGAGYEIVSMKSHVDDADQGGRIFSRDCMEHRIRTPAGAEIVLLLNHLKSKGYGSQAANDAKRLRQAQRVRAIYDGLVAAGEKYVAVLGDFNDVPTSAALAPLLVGSGLKDISEHQGFDANPATRPGTFGTGTAANKIDYILLSPKLFAKANSGGIWRLGAWGGTNGTLWPHYPEIQTAAQAASDHCAIWADIQGL